ncbi:hypothetical protein BDN72DRAFT_893819 [Pluteus cervinus]|uniref:Uncharacterized protein n=1 Tax=Pluteus cervinus TaxID=181527 RepID=A0ACD3B7H6_9AGAR|nr:hypothetical protein BDN72DRAFT_893819 [Pluteus cervinus]
MNRIISTNEGPIVEAGVVLTPETVPLRTGPPTREELLVYYPAKFTWEQLKVFVTSGDLGLLKRDRSLHKRYGEWAVDIVEEYGSVVNYLTSYRLQWGKPDTRALLRSALDVEYEGPSIAADTQPQGPEVPQGLPYDAPAYFTAKAPPEYISIIQNDWPYSIPADVEHTLIWTRLPIFHPDLIHESVTARVEQDGLWGFTGLVGPPPDLSLLPTYLPALAEWGITMDRLIRSERGSEEQEEAVRRAGQEVQKFVRNRWDETKWETAWFVNPPRLQSVRGLAHVHVFAKQKDVANPNVDV